ncbi:MAG: carbohydrate porin [Candidatus Tectomicrobia bacterium]|uniref:Carbohydrate porin n=1 Tax=Tectimicrobiota bacterium TaxID=2528274 RepID=A0A938B2K1_UNCTE|nr:carbohydrate porin [Candidatus Tectomicrobia bacterium]
MAHARNSEAFLRTQPADTPRAETTLEWSYRAAIFPWLRVQPDFQYVINPGTHAALRNALAFTLRVKLTL